MTNKEATRDRDGVDFIYLNGRLVPRGEAVVSVFDHSFLYGIGVFETLRAYGARVLHLDTHIDRLYRSASAIYLNVGMKKGAIGEAVYETLRANNLDDAYIRITVSQGEGEPGLDPSLCKSPNIVIYAKPFETYPEKLYKKGVKAAIVSVLRQGSPLSGIPLKSCNYLNNYLAKVEAKNAGAFEGIMLSKDGRVTEGTVSNIFMVRDNMIVTPTDCEEVLDGVTRNMIIELAIKAGIEIRERDIIAADLEGADEIFITNTLFEVMPVTRLDDRIVGSGEPGEVTLIMSKLYREEIARLLVDSDMAS
ncbi:MAG: branched-chain-amino-acid transaminase [Nitrospinota bacterium]